MKDELLTISELLSSIQKKLHVAKKHRNEYQKYSYRTCEDILEALKPLVPECCFITLSDEMVMVGERYYLKSTASFHACGETISVTAYAREPLEKRGSEASQITGGCSTYSRRYALSGLFCIDGSEEELEIDTADNRDKPEPVTEKELETLKSMIKSSETDEIKLLEYYKLYSLSDMDRETYNHAMTSLERKIAKILGK